MIGMTTMINPTFMKHTERGGWYSHKPQDVNDELSVVRLYLEHGCTTDTFECYIRPSGETVKWIYTNTYGNCSGITGDLTEDLKAEVLEVVDQAILHWC